MRFLLGIFLLAALANSSAVAQSLQIEEDQFDTQPGENIHFEFDGETLAYRVRSRTDAPDHSELVLEESDGSGRYAATLQRTVENRLHLHLQSMNRTFEGGLSANGIAELEYGSRIPLSSDDWPCSATPSSEISPSPLVSSHGGTRFSLDTDIVRAARPCTIWELETPLGTFPLLIHEVTTEAPAYIGVNGAIPGTEGNDRFGHPRHANLTVYDPCAERYDDEEFCWQLQLRGQTDEDWNRSNDLLISALPTRRTNKTEIVISETGPATNIHGIHPLQLLELQRTTPPSP